MEMFDYLSRFEEAVPDWLTDNAFNLKRFFASRTVVYPGAGCDGHAIEIFNRSHSAHCFVYIDQDYRTDQIHEELSPKSYAEGFFYIRGYDVIFAREYPQGIPGTQPYSGCSAIHLCVYERNSEYDDCWGAERIALLLVGAEAHATYQCNGFMEERSRPLPRSACCFRTMGVAAIFLGTHSVILDHQWSKRRAPTGGRVS